MLSDILQGCIVARDSAEKIERKLKVRKRSSSVPPTHTSHRSILEALKTSNGKPGTVILRTDFKTVVVQNKILEKIRPKEVVQPMPHFRQPYPPPSHRNNKRILRKAATSLPLYTSYPSPYDSTGSLSFANQYSKDQINMPNNSFPTSLAPVQNAFYHANHPVASQPFPQARHDVMHDIGSSTTGWPNLHPTTYHDVVVPPLLRQGTLSTDDFLSESSPSQFSNDAICRKRSLSQPFLQNGNQIDYSTAGKRFRAPVNAAKDQAPWFMDKIIITTSNVADASLKSYFQL